ncbi:cytochrome b6-f complex iron-sulfur subunit [Dyadobacter jejuensis]|uniref:Cytochrome b6-f complex iron-sulfur subunit n=1 Tax=Dyadobacter jejuensis TaxID=1082580 RepID=A0A316B354_9BACT|nr:Rieske 2Fe-2S domain-containing protein [Dyadobacter jejuensis]PWJ56987.1 cytochrome b6-f complex iron-sulfur subunit [Dyadobacter jejuensis]
MKRGEFLKGLGLSTSSLMAFYCLGTGLSACGTTDEDPDPSDGGTGVTGTTTGSSINFTVDLGNSSNAKLKIEGEYQIFGDVLVAFTTQKTYVALAKRCTHVGTELQYQKGDNNLYCNNHGSEFSTSGSVQKGPSTGETIPDLQTYKITLSMDGNILTVTS